MLIHLLYSASNMLVIYMYSVLFKWSYLLPKYVYLMLKQEFEALRCHCHCSWLALVPCLPPPLFQDLPPSISSQAHNVDPPSPAYCCTMQLDTELMRRRGHPVAKTALCPRAIGRRFHLRFSSCSHLTSAELVNCAGVVRQLICDPSHHISVIRSL
jgi:hypothetical protein